MARLDDRTTQTSRYCAYCGHAVANDGPRIERFGERFCSEEHADEFAASVRSARRQTAARAEAPGTGACSLPPPGERAWKDYLKRGACWGAPLLLLLAVPLFWSGNAIAAAGGSLLSVLALLACPLGMYFMMRAMGGTNHGAPHSAPSETDRTQDSKQR